MAELKHHWDDEVLVLDHGQVKGLDEDMLQMLKYK